VSTLTAPAPDPTTETNLTVRGTLARFGEGLFRISVPLYHRMIAAGLLGPDDNVELLEGLLVKKMSKNPPHRVTKLLLQHALAALLPAGWFVDEQEPVVTEDSEPEPDLSVLRGEPRDYLSGHPETKDIALVVEIADTSLDRDRAKRHVYARAGFLVYWLVNIGDRRIEVYTSPHGTGDDADYQSRQDFNEADAVHVILDTVEIGRIAVRDILP
jgi:Uma2 family endonuclease